MTTTADLKFTPFTFDISTNRYPGTCGCGTYVAARDGYFDGQVFCSIPGTMGDLAWVCESTAKREMKQKAEAIARRRENTTYVPIDADIERATRHVGQDAEWATRGLKRCGRCGGAGGASHWPGFTCYDCGGNGAVIDN